MTNFTTTESIATAVARHNERMSKVLRTKNAKAILSGSPLKEQAPEYATTLEPAFAKACSQH